jgi:hypothetical protein
MLSACYPPASFKYPERRIILTDNDSLLHIGRTSRRVDDYSAKVSNAWFDSAVMSRNHAEISVDIKEKVRLPLVPSRWCLANM